MDAEAGGGPPASSSRTARSATLVAAAILLSRFIGLARQTLFAFYFGTSDAADAFSAALKIPNVTQNLLGEGVLSASFIPIYVQALGQGDAPRARRFARDVLGLLLLVVAGISVLGAIFARPLAEILVPGFHDERLDLAVHLVRIFFPMTGFMALSAWGLGVLNSHRRFFLPYAAPVMWSLCQIAALLLGSRFASGARLAIILGYGALVGGMCQFGVQLPAVRRLLGSLGPTWGRPSVDVRRAVTAFVPVLLGRGVVQISSIFDTFLASLLPTGGNAALSYMQTIYSLPVSLFGVGAAAAALPEMARKAGLGQGGRERIRQELVESLTRVGFTTVPTTFGFWALSEEMVGLVLQGGRFNAQGTLLVAGALAAAGSGLLANASVRLFASAFYALEDTRTPATMSVLRIVLAIGASYLLMQRYGVTGLAAGSALGAWLEAGLMANMARRRLGGLPLPAVRWAKMCLAALLAAAAGYGVKVACAPLPLRVHAVLSLAAFGAVYAVVSLALGVPEAKSAWRGVGRRLRRR